MASGHVWSGAKGTICVDFDGTIVDWSHDLNGPFTLKEGVKEALVELDSKGYQIVIFTSRLSPTWLLWSDNDPWEQQSLVEDFLEDNGIPFSYVTAEKVPALWYIDDRAVAFRGNWTQALKEVLTSTD